MAARSNRKSSRPTAAASSAGGLWVWVLVGLGLGVGVLIVVAMGSAGSTQEQVKQIPPPPVLNAPPHRPKPYPDLEPWRGLEQGMTMEQVRKLFGDPQKLSSYKGQETWEIYDNAEGSGIFSTRGAVSGQWVKIKFSKEGKVVMFWHYEAEPKTPDPRTTEAPATP
jgi:hypothetical protein